MNFSDETYLWLALAIGGPVSLLLMIDFGLRKRGTFMTGWVGAAVIVMAWCAGIALILHRVS